MACLQAEHDYWGLDTSMAVHSKTDNGLLTLNDRPSPLRIDLKILLA